MNDLVNSRNYQRPKKKKKRHGCLIFFIVILVIIIAFGIILYSRYDTLIMEGDYISDNSGILEIREDRSTYVYSIDGITAHNENCQIIEKNNDVYLIIAGEELLVEVSQYTLIVDEKVFEREDTNMPFWLEKIVYVFCRDILLKIIDVY